MKTFMINLCFGTFTALALLLCFGVLVGYLDGNDAGKLLTPASWDPNGTVVAITIGLPALIAICTLGVYGFKGDRL